ncbi:probable G-protein coupled receptor 34 [Cygnus olor]|uniref:probable G-protein coupled receptor 34 n=1 Tax=Cygnus olor TaxID=8869 RepID=UPI001ADEA48E|nr:probable G-protein coupled receptor 34 [Cygnus olor]XP_040401446.1 probable G-protein coupled receptor 34 [Cygnus olor]XP_040401447.1 probable G-protein coupled receptor 34 [Cygnus olor]
MMAAASADLLTILPHEKASWSNQTHLATNASEIQNNTSCFLEDDALSFALILFYSVIFVVGLAGNVIALFAFLCIHQKRNSIQVYLLNVAIADLLLIFCLPFRILYHVNNNTWMFGHILCKIVGTLFYMNMYISIVLLGLISLDRYVKITKSVKRPKMLTATQSIYICCAVWALALTGFLVVVAPSFFKSEVSNSTMCFHYRNKKNAMTEAVLNYIIVIIFWTVFFLLILSYVKIAKNLLKISRRRSNFPNAGKYTRTARNSFIVLIIFTICFVPYHIFRFVYITSQLQNTPCYWKGIIHKSNEVMLIFSSFNSCLDPVMYFLMSRTVRKTVFQLICRRIHGDSSITLESTSEIKLGQYTQERFSTTTPHSSSVKKKSDLIK